MEFCEALSGLDGHDQGAPALFTLLLMHAGVAGKGTTASNDDIGLYGGRIRKRNWVEKACLCGTIPERISFGHSGFVSIAVEAESIKTGSEAHVVDSLPSPAGRHRTLNSTRINFRPLRAYSVLTGIVYIRSNGA
jgi:hypothetical protein